MESNPIGPDGDSSEDEGRSAETRRAREVVASWEAQLGKLLTGREFVSRCPALADEHELSDAVADGRVIELRLSDGEHRVYPASQIDAWGQLLPDLAEILTIFKRRADAGRWMIASWLTSPQHDFGGATPTQWLRQHGGLDVHLRLLTTVTATRWGPPPTDPEAENQP